ncbi:MAG: hypothetical protein ACLQG3_02115 [Terracidiphilus sp.]
MKSKRVLTAKWIAAGVALLCAAVSAASQQAQTWSESRHKPIPVKIEKQIMIFPESVVLEQWPHTPPIANPPQNLKLLNPGQCVRIGIVVTGDDRDAVLEKTQLSFRVEFAGQAQDHPLAPLASIKRMKPQGEDMINAALLYAGVPLPDMASASLAASAANWCVPDDAQDGSATIDAEAETPGGHKKFTSATIQIESFDTGSKRTFKDGDELEKYMMGYHYQPNPARLFPLLQYFAADTKYRAQTGSLETTAALIGAALKADPAAAKDFMTRAASQTGFTRAFGLLVLLGAGYDIDPALKTMSEEDRQKFANHPVLPDPFDFSHVEDIGTRLDMLWSIFMTTGHLAPVQKISTALAWRPDWEDFDKARKSSNPPKEWTPAIGGAVGYGAAGWSLGSFQRTDPLAADYIEYLIASPDTSEAVKTELKGLATNPAFRQEDKK